ncbi:hypothetical protein V8C86DRAFT_2678301 [Haematococcus lacustris]
MVPGAGVERAASGSTTLPVPACPCAPLVPCGPPAGIPAAADFNKTAGGGGGGAAAAAPAPSHAPSRPPQLALRCLVASSLRPGPEAAAAVPACCASCCRLGAAGGRAVRAPGRGSWPAGPWDPGSCCWVASPPSPSSTCPAPPCPGQPLCPDPPATGVSLARIPALSASCAGWWDRPPAANPLAASMQLGVTKAASAGLTVLQAMHLRALNLLCSVQTLQTQGSSRDTTRRAAGLPVSWPTAAALQGAEPLDLARAPREVPGREGGWHGASVPPASVACGAGV